MISAAQIRAARGLLGWSQALLATRAKVSRSAVARLELGETDPHDETVHAIYLALTRAGVIFIHEPIGLIEGVQQRVPKRRLKRQVTSR